MSEAKTKGNFSFPGLLIILKEWKKKRLDLSHGRPTRLAASAWKKKTHAPNRTYTTATSHFIAKSG
ncbi:hypothetical protein, partial [Acinetobacter baumannii]|uniref:hypothetical protein n=1 Tax=Acinetobacter baumannii TaxID=470 RepID=UPI002278DF29